tara:strand:+ start:18186 stop:19475 length:1290 start_codon:yes stop_codon:yes gene_type:complete
VTTIKQNVNYIKMKNRIFVIALSLLSAGIYAQKDELKTAERALKKGDYQTAIAAVKSLDAMEASMADKYKARYYFVKGQAYSTSDLEVAADAFNNLFAYEKEKNKNKYTSKAQPLLQGVIKRVSERAIKLYNAKDFKNATGDFYLTYKLSPKDTIFLYNAAVSASLAKEYDRSIKYYRNLLDIGYTGISTNYFAINKKTGVKENMGSKAMSDAFVRSGSHEKPTVEKTKSKQADIVKNISFVLIEQGKTEEAIVAIKEARKQNPKDVNLILNEANLYIKLEDNAKFAALMKEAIALNPNDPNLYFNLGVINQNDNKIEDAIGYYEKAISLDPKYRNAYLNIGVAILGQTDALAEEMGKNFQNEKKYVELEKQRLELLKKALPYIEKGDNIKRDIETVRQLVSIYDILEMTEKADKLRPIFKEMRENQKQ